MKSNNTYPIFLFCTLFYYKEKINESGIQHFIGQRTTLLSDEHLGDKQNWKA
jgi:hypothetical protein